MSETTQKLAGSLSNIRHQAKLMRDNLGEGHLLQALKNCSNFLNELRSSAYSPKEYYELYMAVFDALESLSAYLLQSNKSKQAKNKNAPFLTDLYELVQYSGNIVPRLYMMIVIGTTCMASQNVSTKDIMKDMMEMCRGVQHPVRGLFLRHYLSQKSKDLLPISTRDEFDETVDFLLINFVEMNKLWVRLQHQGHSSERALRYQERKELKILVGSNLVRLSQVIDDFSDKDYSPVEFYRTKLFPTVTEQVIQCKDHLAQSYLIDVLIQIFPASFHFATLDPLLNDVFLGSHSMLRKSELVATLVDRFVTYYKYESDLEKTTEKLALEDKLSGDTEDKLLGGTPVEQIFESFWHFYSSLLSLQPPLPAEDYINTLQSLIKFSLTFDADNYKNLDKIYSFASKILALDDVEATGSAVETQTLWVDLLITPLSHSRSIKSLISLEFYYKLFENISNEGLQKKLALEIIKVVLESVSETGAREYLSTNEEIDNVFKYVSVLIKKPDTSLNTSKDLGVEKVYKLEGGEKLVTPASLEAQELACKAVHLIRHEDALKWLADLLYVKRKYFNKAHADAAYTYPTLVTKMTHVLRLAGMQAARTSQAEDEGQTDVVISSQFKHISVIIDELYQQSTHFNAEVALKLHLTLASVADQLKLNNIAYELFNQAFVVYEESLILSPVQGAPVNPQESMGGSSAYQAILAIANSLACLRYFDKKQYEALITKVTLYGSKLLKKQDQCRAIYNCAHLWWWCDPLIDEKSPTVEEESTEPESAKNADGEPKEEAAPEKENDDNEENDEDEKTQDNEDKKSVASALDEPSLYRDPKRVLECLQKSLRVADSCMDPYLLIKLFVEILMRCVIFNLYDNWLVDSRYISGLIDLIKTNMANFNTTEVSVGDDTEALVLQSIEGLLERQLGYLREQTRTENRFQDVVF